MTCSICPGSTFSLPEGFAERERELDVFPDQPAQQCRRAGDELIQVHDDRLKRLLAAEGQELVGEMAGEGRRLANLFEVLVVLRAAPRMPAAATPCSRESRSADC